MASAGGSGVLVLGLHRRSIWETARAIALMRAGLLSTSAPTAARVRAERRLDGFNDALLAELGGSLLAPPQLEIGWASVPEREGSRAEGRARLLERYPRAPWFWADARHCLLQPFWVEALATRPLVVLVHTPPLEVARGLAQRGGLAGEVAAAIWERCLRAALTDAAGGPALVVPRDGLVSAPARWAQELARFLAAHGIVCDPEGGPGAVARFLDSQPRVDRRRELPELTLSEPQRELDAQLGSLAGAHAVLERAGLPPETESTEPLLAERRRLEAVGGEGAGRSRTPARRVRRVRRAVALATGRARRREPGRAREAPGSMPDFVIIGAQKSGTTSLFNWIGQASAVELPRRKEPHFFSVEFDRGLDWYRSQLRPRGADRRRSLTGEASTSYLYHPLAPARLARSLPGVRLIALLRDPVERAISSYWHEVRRGREHLDLAAALDAEEERIAGERERVATEPGYRSFADEHFSYKAKGLYADQVERWRALFGPERLLVVESGRLFRDPLAELRRVTEFLGLDEAAVGELRPRMRARRPSTPLELDERLRAEFDEPNERLFGLLGEDFGWNGRR